MQYGLFSMQLKSKYTLNSSSAGPILLLPWKQDLCRQKETISCSNVSVTRTLFEVYRSSTFHHQCDYCCFSTGSVTVFNAICSRSVHHFTTIKLCSVPIIVKKYLPENVFVVNFKHTQTNVVYSAVCCW